MGDLSLVRPSSVTPPRSSRKTVTTRRISSAPRGAAGRSSERPSWSTRRATMSTSSSTLAGSGSTTVLKRRRSALDSSLTPRSRSLAVAMRLKPADGLHLAAQLRHRQRLLGQDRDQRVLHVGRDAGQLLDPGDRALGHRPHDRAGHQRVRGWGRRRAAARSSSRSGSASSGGAGGALDQQGRVAADRGGQVLGHPGLRGARARRAAAARGRWPAWRRRPRRCGAGPRTSA